LAGRLIAAQEAERARLAPDLYDDTSQQISCLAIALSNLQHRVGSLSGEALSEALSSLQERTIALAENIRQVSHDLHPRVLQHAGLVAALTSLCAELKRNHTIELSFSAEGDFESADRDAALCAYRVAQEALRNVVAHAEARHVEIRLHRAGDNAELTIVDDGKGFDVVEAHNGTGLGLVSINERVRLAGGLVTIVTDVNKGTLVHAQIPSNRKEETDVPEGIARSGT
jgi:two-component system sensor histidine kinase UhpB